MEYDSEEWRPVVGWETFYEVSNLGRVAALKNGERFLRKPNRATHYLTISLKRRPQDTYQPSPTIHSLVASAFLGERPYGHVIRHLDGDRYNNNVKNLVYGKPEENWSDTRFHGTHVGSKNGRAKFEELGVKAVKMLLRRNVSTSEIARELGVSVQTIHAIKTGRNWSHIK